MHIKILPNWPCKFPSSYVIKFSFMVLPSVQPSFFFCVLGCFYPLCVRSPLDTLESGVLFHIWWLSTHLFVLHDKSAMESSVVSSLPDVTFTPTPRKHGVERSTMKHSSKPAGSPHMWDILLIVHHQLSYLREKWPLMEYGSALDEPFFGMPTRIRVMGKTYTQLHDHIIEFMKTCMNYR